MKLRKITPKNKKAQGGDIMPLVIFVGALFVILFVGFLMVVGGSVVNWVFDEAVPELSNLGSASVGGANFTEVAELTISPVNSFVQKIPMLTGVVYVFMIIGVMGMALMFRGAPDKWLMSFFFALVFILILASIFMSNIYEDFATGGGELATRMQEHTVINYMILHSPTIFTMISFIAGIILFTGREEGFV